MMDVLTKRKGRCGVQQLSGLDASFLYLETPNSPMHIGGLTIYDPSTAKSGKVGFKQILANVAQRAHLSLIHI